VTDVKSDTPSPAARAPKHPDHARWVRDRTLKMEADYALATGRTYRDAELANQKSLERLSGKARDERPTLSRGPRKPPREGVVERHAKRAEQGVTIRPAPVLVAPVSLCKHCGRCKTCKLEVRVLSIQRKGREGDVVGQALSWELAGAMLAHQARKDFRGGTGVRYEFSQLTPRDRTRAFLAAVASVCDRSVKLLGAWR
jgi:hypothetical protein